MKNYGDLGGCYPPEKENRESRETYLGDFFVIFGSRPIRTASKRKETVKGQGSKSTNHRTYTDPSLTFVFFRSVVTVSLSLNFRTRPRSTLRKKRRKKHNSKVDLRKV